MANEGIYEMEYLKEKVKIAEARNEENTFSNIKLHNYLFFKRVMDISLSVIAFLILMLPMIIIGILIKIDSPGPVLFKQERLGTNGKPFMIYKFRSMKEDAEKDGPQWADKEDNRCTRIGKVLRKSRLDEFPQLINILRGDMSIVGPRPEREYFYKKFSEYIPDFRKRLRVQPGLTGWAQVNGGYDLSPEEKLKYDLEYIEHRSILLDCKCILKTVRLIFTHEGAR